MPRKARELRAELRRAGFAPGHQTGSHQVWKHPLVSGVSVNVAGHDGADAKPYQERDQERDQEREVKEALRRLNEAKRKRPKP